MGYLKNLKLKYQLILLIAIGIFMMILVQLIYYSRFYYMIQDRTRIYAENIIDQVNNKLESTADSTRKAALTAIYNTTVQDFLKTEKFSKEKKRLSDSTYDLFYTILNSNPHIVDISLVYNDDDIFSTVKVFDQVQYYQLNSQYNFNDIKDSFFPPISSSNTNIYYYYYIVPIYDLNSTTRNRLGTCVMLCKIKHLEDIVKNTYVTKNSLFTILDNNNTVVASNRNDENQKVLDSELLNIIKTTENNSKVYYKGKLSMVQIKNNENILWKTVSIIPIDELTEDLYQIRHLGFFIGIATALLLSIIGYTFIKNITNPIARIVKLMDEIGKKNIKQRIEIEETNEVGIIANDINKMLDEIETMTKNIFNMQNTLYEMELGKKEAEISSLQSQINPHFLYNTLECLRSIGNSYNSKEVVSISTAMAKIFRFSIKGSNFVKIKEEVKIIKEYLKIMQIRYMDKFKIELNINESLYEVQIIKMILQPIVENAIYHGLEAKDGPGKLTINGMIEEGIEFQIIDDGIGIGQQEVDRLNSSFDIKQTNDQGSNCNKRSIGLSNINSRIKLYYGNQYGIRVYSKEKEGTMVIVSLPFIDNTDTNMKSNIPAFSP